jgi:hypothetical protein
MVASDRVARFRRVAMNSLAGQGSTVVSGWRRAVLRLSIVQMDHRQGVVRLLVRWFRGWLFARGRELRPATQVGRHPMGPSTQPQVTPDAFKVRHFSAMLQCSIKDSCDFRLTKVSRASPPPAKRAIPSARNDFLARSELRLGKWARNAAF